MSAKVFDARVCMLGEGPLWHPQRAQFFWMDILSSKLYSRKDGAELEWTFRQLVSAAGWVDAETLLLATETGLSRLSLSSGKVEQIVAVEADNPATRSNDGRADRQGGFWFGTMSKAAEAGQGAIYRYYRGDLREIATGITIPNAICFSRAGDLAYYADTAQGLIWSQPLDDAGWPLGERDVFLNLTEAGLHPDGAVIDSEGALCVACWGEAAVIRFAPDGRRMERFAVGGLHSSCPAFGGADYHDLLVTTAQVDIEAPDAAQGLTYVLRSPVPGLPEPRVIL